MNNIIYLEDSWFEDADDIILYAKKNNYILIKKTYQELLDFNSLTFFDNLCLCNTEIIQHHLKKLGKTNIIPDTYESNYEQFFCRNIEKMPFGEFKNKYLGATKFIKPSGNNKSFDGRLVKDLSDFTDFCIDIPDDDLEIYVIDPIKIISEVRLLIGNNKLYGHGFISSQNDISYLTSNIIKNLIVFTGEKFRCIDIGLVEINNTKKWIVIEVNPPFSLNNYDIDLDNYFNFCIDSFIYIKKDE